VSGEDDNKKSSKDEALLKVLKQTEVEKDQVVSMVGGLVGMLGRMGGATGITMPASTMQQAATHAPKKEMQKNIKHISEKLEEAANAHNVECIRADADFLQWLQREGCKLKNFHEEMKFTRRTLDLAVESKDYDLGLMAAAKAINIGGLHARKDHEMLSELYWVQAELFAVMDKMPEAKSSLKQCVKCINPEANEDSDTYRELAQQLEETREKALAAPRE